jgi:hypothetical protein
VTRTAPQSPEWKLESRNCAGLACTSVTPTQHTRHRPSNTSTHNGTTERRQTHLPSQIVNLTFAQPKHSGRDLRTDQPERTHVVRVSNVVAMSLHKRHASITTSFKLCAHSDAASRVFRLANDVLRKHRATLIRPTTLPTVKNAHPAVTNEGGTSAQAKHAQLR